MVASVGTYSGVAGGVLVPLMQGAQVWAKSINARGGLNGHLIRFNIYDDGGDPARHRAEVQAAVEQDKAIAFLQQNGGLTQGSDDGSSVQYITSKRIPVIGTDTETGGVYASPMFFPQATSLRAGFEAWITSLAQQAVPASKTKLGMIYCAESPQCSNGEQVVAQRAPRLGFSYVYQAKASIAQPDYTAECLSARNAGVEVFLVLLDQNSVSRVAASCARQGFRPTYSVHSGAVADRFKDDPNLDGLLVPFKVFPYYQTGTQATDEFQRAMQAYGGSLSRGAGPAMGWVSGKLLERAGAQVLEPPTTAALLEGLWAINGDDLGGLTQPVTFVRDQPAKPLACWFNGTIIKGSWESPDGFARHCQSPSS